MNQIFYREKGLFSSFIRLFSPGEWLQLLWSFLSNEPQGSEVNAYITHEENLTSVLFDLQLVFYLKYT